MAVSSPICKVSETGYQFTRFAGLFIAPRLYLKKNMSTALKANPRGLWGNSNEDQLR
jgi:hypothetical protein